jgi:predicted nicotinamide N-methyase
MIDDELCSLGFMFDACHQRETRAVILKGDLVLQIRTIGDRPGHLQSGQYIWPASIAAANYIINRWDSLQCKTVLELGSGCGITGIALSKMEGVQSVIMTDYDLGSLQLISENIQLNGNSDSSSSRAISSSHYLEWGAPIPPAIQQLPLFPLDGFRLVVGADLVYSKDVIPALLRTVHSLLHKSLGVFILVSSFRLSDVSSIHCYCVLNRLIHRSY